MAGFQLSGRVVHAPGPWGLDRPVKGAQIKVRDIDLPGRRDDLILETRTNDNGAFNGQSAEWRDRDRITIAEPAMKVDRFGVQTPTIVNRSIEVDDPLDVPKLTVEVQAPAGPNLLSLPLIVPPGSTAFEFPPVIVPWPPGGAPAKLDGTDYWDPIQLNLAIIARVDQRKNFTASIYGPEADLIGADRADAERMLAWLASRQPHLAAILQALLRRPDGVSKATDGGTILALAILVLAASAGTAMVISSAAISIALIVALLSGYDVSLNEEIETALDGTVRRKVNFVAVRRSELYRSVDQPAAVAMTASIRR